MISITSFILLFSTFLSLQAGSGATPLESARPNKATIILIPAAFSKPAVYDDVKARLSSVGYDVVSVDLPSVGLAAAYVDRTPDIKVVQHVLRSRLDQGKNVILVGNSYGGTVICDAVKDFEAKSSVKAGAPANGKILGLIFFAGFLPYTNEPSGARPDIRQISPSWFRFEGTSRVFWDNDLATQPPSVTLFNKLPKAKQDYWSSKLAPSSFDALNATAKYIPYDGKFRSSYVIGSEDYAVPPAFAQSYITQPTAQFEVVNIEADHMPMLSNPNEFVEVVRNFAGDNV